MTDPVSCPRCLIPGFEEWPPVTSYFCPLCGYDRVVSPELAGAYRLLASTRSLDMGDVLELRSLVLKSPF